jgi:AcrR family transcriptional regulator
MSGKTRIQTEDIVNAAIAIIRESGWAAVSARKLAERLGASTMPIYSSVGSMESLRSSVFSRVMSLIEEAQSRKRSGNLLMDKALGYIAFAREEGRLFRFIFERGGMPAVSVKEFRERFEEIGERDESFIEAFGKMSREGTEAIGFHSWVYVHGLACMLADGFLEIGDEEILRCLETVSGAIVSHIGGIHG